MNPRVRSTATLAFPRDKRRGAAASGSQAVLCGDSVEGRSIPPEKAQRVGLEARVTAQAGKLTQAEACMARFFLEHKEAVVLESAARIAEAAGGSDATVVRAAKSLGYSGLAELRQDILSELIGAAAPLRRATRTLDTSGESLDAVRSYVVDLHQSALDSLRDPALAESFAHAVGLIAAAKRRHIFGNGFLAVLADYVSLRFNRLGFRTDGLTATGIALTDRLAWLESDDVVLMMVHVPFDAEAERVIGRAAELCAPVVLISDASGAEIDGRIAETLLIPRGQTNDVALHGVTIALVETLILGLVRHRGTASSGFDAFATLRGRIDGDSIERRPRHPRSSPDLHHASPSPARRRNERDI